jgi:hypothetical protein
MHSREANAKTTKARIERAFVAYFHRDLELRAGPPTVGVMVCTIVVAGQHTTARGRRNSAKEVVGFGTHESTSADSPVIGKYPESPVFTRRRA